jgi:hypothetical protein
MMLTHLLLAAVSLSGCGPHQEISDRLEDSGYSMIAGGLVGDGALLFEIYADEAGDWVALLTRASDRISCIKIVGSGWAARQSGYPA